MGFGGGGGGVLTAHTHDPAIPRDGGSLAANATSFSLANQSLLVSDGVNIQELGIGSEGDNLTSIGGALSWEAHVAGDVLASNLVMSNSTTIGDYTQPAAATCSSAGSGASGTEADFLGPGKETDWDDTTDINYNTVSDVIDFSADGPAITDSYATYDLQQLTAGVSASDTQWVLRFKLDITTYTATDGSSSALVIGISNQATSSGAAVQNGIGFEVGVGNVDQKYRLQTANAAVWARGSPDAVFVKTPAVETIYLEVVRSSATDVTVSIFSSDAYTPGVLLEAQTINTVAGTTGLRYVSVKSDTQSQPNNRLIGTVTELEFWNNTAVATSSCAYAIDDDVATSWVSDSEVNPNIYVDMTSATTTSNLALYPNVGTTETEIKIQSSTDAIVWTDERTITFSNLTTGAWNYIRFNIISARYWRIYGSSGGAGVLQIDEIKVLDSVSDANVRNLHGHIPISSTDTSLNNAGV